MFLVIAPQAKPLNGLQTVPAKAVWLFVVDIRIFLSTHFFYFSFTLLQAQELGLNRIGGGRGTKGAMAEKIGLNGMQNVAHFYF